MGFLDRQRPRWFTIPADRPFLDDLAAGLIDALASAGPQALSAATVLTPTRRAARGLAEAFVRAGGGRALLLPQIRAIGDLDEGEPPFEPGELALDLPAAISPWRRRIELARIIDERQDLIERSLDGVAALELADVLGGFLDSLAIEEAAPPADLDDWVDEGLARHWQVTARFLAVILDAWPARLAELGLIDVAARRVALLRALGDRWRAEPPAGPLIAAGSTGSSPATADLLAAVAAAPEGAVVLPGLDLDLAEAAWAEVGEEHPQGAMKRLLERAGVTRDQVGLWTPGVVDSRGRWRRRIINEALRPADSTADWLGQIARLREEAAGAVIDPIAEGLSGLTALTARTEEEAALTAALLLRETLQTPGETAALITPDAVLARRVSARLARWGIEADSSAGASLAGYPAAQLAGLVARAAAEGLDPVALLAIAKHPLSRMGREAEDLTPALRRLERFGLRGPRPPSRQAILARLAAEDDSRAAGVLDDLLAALDWARAPFAGGTAPVDQAARALAGALERLARAPGDDGVGALWTGADGEALGGLIATLIEEAGGPDVSAARFADLIEDLLAREVVRAGFAAHPRIRILGAIEARMVRADRLILAGLEEGVWPPATPIDPFLSRPMRRRAGLPPPERRLGLAAHDFAQAACAPNVVLLGCERRDGAPAVASRWLWRLRILAEGAGLKLPERPEALAWARALDAPLSPAPPELRTAERPRPTPPVTLRPDRLPVTAIERWVRDPYAIYASRILKLRPLERPDEPVEARVRGSAIHRAFERFAAVELDALGDAAFAELLIEELAAAGMPPTRLVREQALARNVAPWVAAFERRRRTGARLLIEQTGEHRIATPGGGFTLTAKADRIELRAEGADILDFKTGLPPSMRQVESGLSPQLTLTAAILHHGGFPDLGPVTPRNLVYVRVSGVGAGARAPAMEVVRGGDGEALALGLEALDGLQRRAAAFENRATPYVSWAVPQFIGALAGDYDHLARVWEWSVIGEGEAADG